MTMVTLWKRFQEGEHPRGPDGRFVDVPDWMQAKDPQWWENRAKLAQALRAAVSVTPPSPEEAASLMNMLTPEEGGQWDAPSMQALQAWQAARTARAAAWAGVAGYPMDRVHTDDDFKAWAEGALGVEVSGMRPEHLWMGHRVGPVLAAWKAEGRPLPKELSFDHFQHRMVRPGEEGGVVPMSYAPGLDALAINMPRLPTADRWDTLIEHARQQRWLVGGSIEDILVHELGHKAHHAALPGEGLRDARWNGWNNDWAASRVAHGISLYAATNPSEFVAEAFLAQRLGRRLTPAQQALYARLQGPAL